MEYSTGLSQDNEPLRSFSGNVILESNGTPYQGHQIRSAKLHQELKGGDWRCMALDLDGRCLL